MNCFCKNRNNIPHGHIFLQKVLSLCCISYLNLRCVVDSHSVVWHPFFIPFFEKMAKLWPKLVYKRKKILLFHSF